MTGHQSGAADRPSVVAIVGPTATGKSALGVALAHALGGEIINADSMQLYRGMDIGTAKLTMPERDGIAHHVLDVWDVTEAASVADYQQRARDAIDQLSDAGRLPLLVGGSGLYARAVLDDLEFPGTDPALRAELEADLARDGSGALHARLAAVDPAAARVILPSNGRRIVRALEVVALTGQPFTATLPEPQPYYPAVQLGIDLADEVLDARVAQRVERMWQDGFVAEVDRLTGDGLAGGRTASRALGYRQILDFLAGDCTEAEARTATIHATRRFVRRQRSWFRRDPRVHWLDGGRSDLVSASLQVVTEALPALAAAAEAG